MLRIYPLEYVNKDEVMWKQKECLYLNEKGSVDISGTHNEEICLGECNTG